MIKNTKGTKNVLNKDLTNISKFWELNKLAKLQKNENKIRTQEQMIVVARKVIENNEIKSDNKYYDFIKNYANAEVVLNKFGKKLYVRLGGDEC